MNWRSCGYLSLTKDGKKISVVVKHVRYVANLDELKAVLASEIGFTEIYEHLEDEQQLETRRPAELMAVTKELKMEAK